MPKNLVNYLYLFLSLFILAGCSDIFSQPMVPIDDIETKTDTNMQHEISDAKMKVHYIDVGQADATLLQLNDMDEEFTILIDTGDWGATDVVTYLQALNLTDIDIIAITHPHADHIGQLDKIIDTFHVSEVWMNGEMATSQVFERSLEAIEVNHVEYYEPQVGDVFDIGPLEIETLHPETRSMGTNNNSLAFRMTYNEVTFLFTGDAEQQAENDMLRRNVNLSADILHLGHHGSSTSTTEDFLKAVRPEVAIYSAGVENQYGHPHEEVLERVKTSGALLYGTDVHGTIIIETDGKAYQVLTHEQGTLPRTATNGSCININTASTEEVQQITHIGPSLAIELVKLRPFRSIDELIKINGIGASRIEDIKKQGLACIGG